MSFKFLFNKKYLIVFILLLTAFGLRAYRIGLNSPPLYIDESAGHYSAWAGFFLPSANFLDFFYHQIFLRFLTFTWLFGLTPLGVRLPSVLWSTLFLLFFFFFAESVDLKKEAKSEVVAFLTLLLGVFLPWSIHLSRIGYATMPIFLLLVCLHLTFYLRANKISGYLWSLLPLAASAYFYPSILIIGPAAMILVLSKTFGLCPKSRKPLLLAVFGLFLMITVLASFRFNVRGFDLAILRDVNVTADSNLYRGLARLSEPTIFSLEKNPEFASRFLFNYPLSVIGVFTRNWLSFFSPDFLFLKGDPILRHSSGFIGVFFPFLAPFIIYGAFLLFSSQNQKVKELFLIWILISPVPAAITKDGAGYLLRVVTMMPFLTYLSALGLLASVKLVWPRLRLLYLLGLLLVGGYSIYYFLFGYFQVYPALAARSFEFGFKEVSDFQMSHDSKPLLVIWDGYYPNFYFRFWQKTDAKEYHQFVPEEASINETKAFRMFPNLYFCLPKTEGDLKQLLSIKRIPYFAFPADLAPKFSAYSFLETVPLKVIYFPDNTPDFYIYSTEQWLGRK